MVIQAPKKADRAAVLMDLAKTNIDIMEGWDPRDEKGDKKRREYITTLEVFFTLLTDAYLTSAGISHAEQRIIQIEEYCKTELAKELQEDED